MDFEKRATEAQENLDGLYNDLIQRLREFCVVRGVVLKQDDVDVLSYLVGEYMVDAMKKGMQVVIDIAKEYDDGNNA